jgi:1,4-alpha-glucan branching enzyme
VNHDRGLDWHLLERPYHAGVQRLLRDLNRCYREWAALHELDCESGVFDWIVADDADHSVFAWMRKGRSPRACCIIIMNFTLEVRTRYRVKAPYGGYWREILNTDAAAYGGSNVGNDGGMVASERGGEFELKLTLPPLSTLRGPFVGNHTNGVNTCIW